MNDALDLNKAENAGEEVENGGTAANIETDENAETAQILENAEENIFLSSLRSLTEKDIDLNETAQTAKKPPVDFVRYFILLICLSIFVYAGYSIVKQLFEYAEAANDNNMLREIFYGNALGDMQTLRRARANRPIQDILSLQRQTARDEVGVIVSEGVPEADSRRAGLNRLFAEIPNMYGHIRVSGTNVDYPVVQWTDDDYYLTRNVYGLNQSSGAVFTDSRNDKNVDNNLHTILYGHNMANGTMFSSLMNLDKRQDLFNEGVIELTTPDGIYFYEIFSVHIVHPMFYYREIAFESEERYVEWLYEMKELSRFQKENIVFTPESRIITLSTCTNYTWGNPRFAVQGVLIDVWRYSR